MGRFGTVLLTAFLAGPSTAAPLGMAMGLSPVFAVLNRFGPAGLGLLGPALIGTWVSAAVGAAFGLARGRLLAWLVAGALVWRTILVAASGALLGWLF